MNLYPSKLEPDNCPYTSQGEGASGEAEKSAQRLHPSLSSPRKSGEAIGDYLLDNRHYKADCRV